MNSNTSLIDWDLAVGSANLLWHCGRVGCDAELEHSGNDFLSCALCGAWFDAEGAFLGDGELDGGLELDAED